jgi:O-antigen/teichoic acid export membrane protein
MTQTNSTAQRVGRGLGWSTTSNLVLRTGNFTMSLIMARLIAPDQFGVFAVALTTWSILGTLAEFGLGTDLVRARDFRGRAPTVATVGLITSGLLALSMAITAGPIAAVFNSPESAPVIRVMAISLLIFGFSIVPAAYLQREIRQGTLFAVNACGLVASATTMAVLAFLGYGPMALALGQVVSQLVVVVGLYLTARVPISYAFDREIAKESALFCLPLATANLLSWLLLSIDNLVVSRMLGPTQLGLYVLAFNISSWPMNAIGQSIRVVALPAFSHVDSVDQRSRALVTANGPLWAVSLMMGTVLAILAVPIVVLLYGERWAAAAVALVGLGVFGALRVAFDLIVTFLIAAGSTRAVLAVQIWWLVTMVPIMWLLVGWFGLAGASWAHVAVGFIFVLPAYLYCLKRAGVDPFSLIRAWIIPTVCIIPTAIICSVIAWTTYPPLLQLAVGGLAVLILYAAPLARWWIAQIKELQSYSAESSPLKMNEVDA